MSIPKIVAVSYYRFDTDYIEDYKENLKDLVDEFVLIKDNGDYHKVGEGEMMRRLKEQAVASGADWILVLDVDERLERSAPSQIREMINNYSGQKVKFCFNFRELFEANKYRVDGVWGTKTLTCLFPARSDNVYSNSPIHTPRDPQNSDYKTVDTGLNIYHLKHTRKDVAEQRKLIYKRLDPKMEIQDYDYLTDQSGIKLRRIEKGREFYPVYREYKIDPEYFNVDNFNNNNTFKKRALITAWSLNERGGAGLNCFELAEELKNQGIMTDFFTYQKNIGPLSRHIESLGYKIYTDRFDDLKPEDEQRYLPIDIEDYDYMLFVANVVPISILRQLNSKPVLPKIITLYMSELVGRPTDAPLSGVLNAKLADLNLTISNKAKQDIMYRILDESVPVDLYRNPAPVEFSIIKKRSGNLERVAVIHSSGTGGELIDACKILEHKGIRVDYIGSQFNNVKEVNAEFYDKYDLVIGIGKNVQYSLVSGVPVYIYGRFGGPGYLGKALYHRIIDEGRADNFSGREYGGFRSADEIAQEILTGYSRAYKFHQDGRRDFIEEYSIDKVVGRIIENVDALTPKKSQLTQKEINWLVSFQILIESHWHDRESRAKDMEVMKSEVDRMKSEVDRLKDELKQENENFKKERARANEMLTVRRSARLLAGNIKRRITHNLKRKKT